ncbi:hypothetical protein E3N88_04440 [Mikania micrantha]|uniref:Uncharacterized protein n=1 Tax=Mikania micrantha TaxID=192012 RepID=A0A5N6PV04_9ASTR|nr:hypothetical protein E3N88_04440 [Mikania micrantha]
MNGVVIVRAEEIGVTTKELSEAFLKGYFTHRSCGATTSNGLPEEEEYTDGGFEEEVLKELVVHFHVVCWTFDQIFSALDFVSNDETPPAVATNTAIVKFHILLPPP